MSGGSHEGPPLFSFLTVPAYQVVNIGKAALAACGALLLLWWWWLDRRGASSGQRRARDLLLAALGVLAFAGWFNFGLFHNGSALHYHEFFHYFLGSKYFDEVGYTRLYHCVAVADAQDDGAGDVYRRWIRDLSTNESVQGARLAVDASTCTSHFSGERWQAFRADVRWFREHVSAEKWRELAVDHGYNATPAWTLVGRALAGLRPASTEFVAALALIDVLLLLVMWAAIWWAFGWRTMCVALLWWGTNYPARFTWTGGAFLRTDFLVPLVLSICLARRGRGWSAGAALGVASSFRIFPLVMAATAALGRTAEAVSTRSLQPLRHAMPVVLGATLSFAAIVIAAYAVVGPDAWAAFAANSRKHVATPSSNLVGLPVLVSFEERTREAHMRALWLDSPWDTWRAARARAFEERRGWYWAMVAAFVAVLAFACRRQDDWVRLTLGVGLIPFVSSLSCYYFSMLLVFAFLWRSYPAIGVGLVGLAAATNVPPALFGNFDDIFVLVSAAVVAFVACSTVIVAVRAPKPAG